MHNFCFIHPIPGASKLLSVNFGALQPQKRYLTSHEPWLQPSRVRKEEPFRKYNISETILSATKSLWKLEKVEKRTTTSASHGKTALDEALYECIGTFTDQVSV